MEVVEERDTIIQQVEMDRVRLATPPIQYTSLLDAIRELEEEEVHSAMMCDRFGLEPSKYNIII